MQRITPGEVGYFLDQSAVHSSPVNRHLVENLHQYTSETRQASERTQVCRWVPRMSQ